MRRAKRLMEESWGAETSPEYRVSLNTVIISLKKTSDDESDSDNLTAPFE
jgi:hypothetical protein